MLKERKMFDAKLWKRELHERYANVRHEQNKINEKFEGPSRAFCSRNSPLIPHLMLKIFSI